MWIWDLKTALSIAAQGICASMSQSEIQRLKPQIALCLRASVAGVDNG